MTKSTSAKCAQSKKKPAGSSRLKLEQRALIATQRLDGDHPPSEEAISDWARKMAEHESHPERMAAMASISLGLSGLTPPPGAPEPHRPGPWEVTGLVEGPLFIRAVSSRAHIAIVADPTDFGCLDEDDKEEMRKAWEGCRANARLIAAAPELFEALSDLLDGIGAKVGPKLVMKCKTALAKAAPSLPSTTKLR